MPAVFRTILAIIVACALGGPAFGAEQPLTPTQALTYVRIGDLHFSPDGATLTYVVASYQWDALPRVRIVEVATGVEHEITPAGKSERTPQWAPDGKMLAFLSNRGGRTQVYARPSAGGEARALTAQKFGVDAFHWSPDGRSIAYLAKDDGAPDSGHGPQIADLESNLARLWLIDVSSGASRMLGKNGFRIDDFQWQSPARLLVSATDTPRVEEYTDRIFSVTTDGTWAVAQRPPQPFNGLLVAPDGERFAIRSTGAKGPIARDIFVGPVNGDSLRNISAPTGLAVAEVRWHEPDTIWLRVIDGFYYRIFQASRGKTPARINLALSVTSFDVAHNGVLAFVGEDYAHLPEIYLRGKDRSVRQLTHLQQGWDGVRLAPVTIFRVASFDGRPIEAALMRPAAASVDEKLPLVLLVHGGPSVNFSAGYSWEVAWAQLLAAHGYQVLMANPRGSNGYSEEFVKANRGDWGGGDYKDLMAALDAVVARGGTDANRLGIGGWSYGGEMSAWAITQTDRFKAAVAGAPVFDQQAEFETEDGPQEDEWYFGTPWEHPEVFARNSPATFIRNAHTPTLIFDGAEDANNPVGQSMGLYRALKHFGVETEMVLYPGEGHSPRLGAYNIDMFERILDWYDAHLH
jgi:dipeptidyl aminopeptidase/acylaminoacyl peptidase